MNKLVLLFLILLFVAGLCFAQDTASAVPGLAPDFVDEAVSPESPEESAAPAYDKRIFEDLGKICSKRFCAVEIFFRNGTYSQMTKSRSLLSNKELLDYDSSHKAPGTDVEGDSLESGVESAAPLDRDAQKKQVADKLAKMCAGKEFCTLEATLHGPSFTFASLKNVTTDIRPRNQEIPRYAEIHYSSDTEVKPFAVQAIAMPRKSPSQAPQEVAPQAAAPQTVAPASSDVSSPVAKKPARRFKNKKFSHAIAFSLGFLAEDEYGYIGGLDVTQALELFPRYTFKWAWHDYVTFAPGIGIAFRNNTLNIDDEMTVSGNTYDYYYGYSYTTVSEEGSISYQNITLDIPIEFRFGSMFFGSVTLDLRKPIAEWYDYEVDFYRNYSYSSFDYDDGAGFDFFAADDAEIGLWLGVGVQHNGFGFEFQALLANDGSSNGTHQYEYLFDGYFSFRLLAEYTF